MSRSSLANFPCAKCAEVTLHKFNVCVHCGSTYLAGSPVARAPTYDCYSVAQMAIARKRAGAKARARAKTYGNQTEDASARRVRLAAERMERRRGTDGRVGPGI